MMILRNDIILFFVCETTDCPESNILGYSNFILVANANETSSLPLAFVSVYACIPEKKKNNLSSYERKERGRGHVRGAPRVSHPTGITNYVSDSRYIRRVLNAK